MYSLCIAISSPNLSHSLFSQPVTQSLLLACHAVSSPSLSRSLFSQPVTQSHLLACHTVSSPSLSRSLFSQPATQSPELSTLILRRAAVSRGVKLAFDDSDSEETALRPRSRQNTSSQSKTTGKNRIQVRITLVSLDSLSRWDTFDVATALVTVVFVGESDKSHSDWSYKDSAILQEETVDYIL